MHALPFTLSRNLDVRTEWSLAVTLQTMSATALEGITARRAQVVIEHLQSVAASQAVSPELRRSCETLSNHWRTIDLI